MQPAPGRDLTAPFVVRGRRAQSRLVFGPHETNLARRRDISDRHVAYYARRAEGGAGVIVTEVASVHPSDRPYERAPLGTDAAAGWADVARACQPHGTLVLAGLGHAGSQGSTAYNRDALWGPSRIADPATREVPMVMEQPEVDALVAGFGQAAELAVRAGLDGVEINAGQHSLLRQFLSGLTNQRTDGYGRDRSLLLREVLATVRAAIGDAVLCLRLCGDELAPWAGITPDAARAVALEVAHLLDLLVVVRGSAMSVAATRPDRHTAQGFNRDLCAGFRCGVPLVLQGSVVDPGYAQRALDDGVADLVEMTRAQIADPDLGRHVRAGRPERVRPCVLSNSRFDVRDPRNPIVSDDAEPRSGHETDDPPVEGRDPVAHEVLVVGGGPAGMEAARVLAMRGHRVRLAERSGVLGGALVAASRVRGRERLGLLVAWWKRELARLGVTVSTRTDVGPADLDAAQHVLLATGAASGEGTTAVRFAADPVLPDGPVLVVDAVGDGLAADIALQVAAAGRPVGLVTPDPVVAAGLGVGAAPLNTLLDRAGVARHVLAEVREVAASRAVLGHVWTGERHEVGCDLLIDCGFRLPDRTLPAARPDLVRIGDCLAPRTVHEAVLDARRAALAIGAAPYGSRQ
ncbi:mycofactocin system FadH/OYE family oxidoreductase 1 [Pseudonocardia sp. TRM90224]|uniref:mycofactocin system FadH/OYE family oxidoreductase 1 n=1 Tax=Pseudonocardia sp. TRM90224 TaxID=2812678 RepID=UPI001E464CC7|nr:mycofactocin system FadH/OYE family oxidoreductase 1 [Pseudonocardia sp. TRM90224]